MSCFASPRASLPLLGLAVLASLTAACADDPTAGAGGGGGGEPPSVTGPSSTSSTTTSGSGEGGSGDGGSGQGGSGGQGGEAPTCTRLPEIVRGPEDAASFHTLRANTEGFAVFGTVFRNGQEELIFLQLDQDAAPLTEVRVPVDSYAVHAHRAEPTADGGWILSGIIHAAGAGTTFAGAELEPASAGYGSDAFIAKLDASGHAVWLHHFGSPEGFGDPGDETWAEAGAYAFGVREDGSIVVTGTIQGSVDLGDGVVRDTGEGGSGFLLALDADGGVDWVRLMGDEWIISVALDATGRVITGSDDGTRCLDADGDTLWTSPEPGWITLDDEGSIYRSDSTNVGYDWNLELTKLDRDGDEVWSHAFATPAFESSGSLAIGPDHRPVVILECEGPIDLGEGPVETCGGRDMCIVWLDEAGETVGSKVFGDGHENSVGGSLVDQDGSLLIAARTWRNPTNGQDDEGFVYRVTP